MLIRLLRQYLRPYTAPIATVLVLQLIQTLATLYLPSLNAQIIDEGIATGDTGYILRTGGWMLAVSLLQVVCAVAAVFFGAKAAMAFGRDVREGLFTRVQDFSAQEVGHFGAPSLITRTTNDVQQVQMVVLLSFTMMVMAPIMLVGGVVMALREDVALSRLLLVVVPVLGIAVGLIVSRMIPYFRSMQKRIDRINAVLREQITGIRVIRSFVREQRESERFAVANTALFDTSVRVGKLMALMFPTVMLVMNASSVAVMWFGAQRIDAGQMSIGALTAFLMYIMYILMAVMIATMMFVMVPRAVVSAERIVEVLDTSTTVRRPAHPVAAAPSSAGIPRGVLELRHAEFRYPGAESPVLRDVSLVARSGQTTAIIGSTGAGKTTLISLVPRLFDVTGGKVLVDGVDVRELEPDDLWSRIGLIPQNHSCSAGRSRRTCGTASLTRPTTSCGMRSTSRRHVSSSRLCPGSSRAGSRRVARMCPAGSASALRSPARWSSNPRSTCSTTRSRRSTSPRMRRCGRRWFRRRGGPPW